MKSHSSLGTALFLSFLTNGCMAASRSNYCHFGESCWPSENDLHDLYQALNPNISRAVYWQRTIPQKPFPCAVPINSQTDQPLYGEGKSLEPLYVQTDDDRVGRCFVQDFYTKYCLIATRNNPMNNWEPAFIVWPTTAQQVQIAIKFATDHNLCIGVAGTGHDFMNRHTCDQGLFIRTTLLKEIEWDLSYSNSYEHDNGKVRVGSGITFSEVQKSASENQRAIASGWSISVGMAGWSMGGGHGPLSPKFGLGVDQILQVEIILADGGLATVNSDGTTIVYLDGTIIETPDADILWAIRGGGGSAFGIVTAYTVKAHPVSVGGYTFASLSANGDLCSGKNEFYDLMDFYYAWTQTLDNNWGGIAYFTPAFDESSPNNCSGTWSVSVTYVYQGHKSSEDFTSRWNDLLAAAPKSAKSSLVPHADMWSALKGNLEYIIPVEWLPVLPQYYAGGIPSVLINRENVINGKFSARVQESVEACIVTTQCAQIQIFHDITGSSGSPQLDSSQVSISPGMRTALYHVVLTVFPTAQAESWYALGNHSYFSESAYFMTDWTQRYWGSENYQKLLAIKERVDPNNVFWCRHCIGDEEYSEPASSSVSVSARGRRGGEEKREGDVEVDESTLKLTKKGRVDDLKAAQEKVRKAASMAPNSDKGPSAYHSSSSDKNFQYFQPSFL